MTTMKSWMADPDGESGIAGDGFADFDMNFPGASNQNAQAPSQPKTLPKPKPKRAIAYLNAGSDVVRRPGDPPKTDPTKKPSNVGRPPAGSKGSVGQSYKRATENKNKPGEMSAEEYNTYVGEGKGAAPGTKVQIAPQQGSKNKPKPTAPATEKPKFVPKPSTPEELERGRRLTKEAYKRSLQNKGRSLDPRTEAYRRQNAGKGINDYGSAAAPQRRKSNPVLDNRRYGSTKNSDMSVGGKAYREAQEGAKNTAIGSLDDKAHGNYVNHIKNGASPTTALSLAQKGVMAETDQDRSNAARDRLVAADMERYKNKFK